jgi:hypothetical protein
LRDGATFADSNLWSRFKPRTLEPSPDTVEIHYIFLEREVGDDLVNKDVWEEADEQIISLDLKKLLNDNGFRVGKLGSRLSPKLLDLLENDARGEGRRHQTYAGLLAKIEATSVIEQWNLFTVIDGPPRGEEFNLAQGYLHVTPALGDKNTVNISMVPVIEYGPRKVKRTASADLTGWQMRNERDSKSFPEMRVDLQLNSGEYALIGCWPDRKGTLGRHYFTREVDSRIRQTVLLVRVVRPSRDDLYLSGYDYDDFFLTPIKRSHAHRSVVQETLLASRRR